MNEEEYMKKLNFVLNLDLNSNCVSFKNLKDVFGIDFELEDTIKEEPKHKPPINFRRASKS